MAPLPASHCSDTNDCNTGAATDCYCKCPHRQQLTSSFSCRKSRVSSANLWYSFSVISACLQKQCRTTVLSTQNNTAVVVFQLASNVWLHTAISWLLQHLLTLFSGLLQSSCTELCSGMLPTAGNAACCSEIPAVALKLSKRPLSGTVAPAAGGSARQLQLHSGQHGTGDHQQCPALAVGARTLGCVAMLYGIIERSTVSDACT